MRLYIAGRIAGTNGYHQKFAEAKAELRALGHEPVSPIDVSPDSPDVSYEEHLTRDIKAMLDCEGVYALRDWKSSKGATIEIQLAMRLNKVIIYQ